MKIQEGEKQQFTVRGGVKSLLPRARRLPPSMTDGDGPWTDAGPVEGQIQELERQVEHLVRSNTEMREFLTETPDADLRAAIGENIVSIACCLNVLVRKPSHLDLGYLQRRR
jgi:hypothetical protein